jgi:predicted Rossmann fold nucleotide-binding protein DprA/Smf involved in DNA uptake
MNSLLSTWQLQHAGMSLTGHGNIKLLESKPSAFFASRQCPGLAIRAALDWAMQKVKQGHAVISGFHSQLERSVLEILLSAKSPVIIVLARDASKAKLSSQWVDALQSGHIVVMSKLYKDTSVRLSSKRAHDRNDLVISLANHIVIAHSSPIGSLAIQEQKWCTEERTVETLA